MYKKISQQLLQLLRHFPLGEFLILSYYRGLQSQIRYSIADITNRRQFHSLNKGMGLSKIAIAPGIVLTTHPDARYAFEHFAYLEPETVEEIQSFLRLTSNKTNLIDVGAHYGLFSLVFAGNPNATTFAIEPSPSAYKTLSYHQITNSNRPIQPFLLAFGDKPGRLKMKTAWTHLVAIQDQNDCTDTNIIEVEVVTLDAFVEQQKVQPEVVKIDVEGFELKVLRGAITTLKKYNPIIFLEVHPSLTHFGDSVEDLVEFLYALDYRIYDTNCRLIKSPVRYLKILRRIICTKESL